jgi:hypothetical protein
MSHSLIIYTVIILQYHHSAQSGIYEIEGIYWNGQRKGTKHSFELSGKYDKDLLVDYIAKKVYWYTHPSRIININYYSNGKVNELSKNVVSDEW